jgi:hypothetical protein
MIPTLFAAHVFAQADQYSGDFLTCPTLTGDWALP